MKSTGTGEHYNYKIWISNWFQVNVMLNQISFMFARWQNSFTEFLKRIISIKGGIISLINENYYFNHQFSTREI